MIDKSLLRVGDVAWVSQPTGERVLIRVVRDGMRPAGVTFNGSRAVDLETADVVEISGRVRELEKAAREGVE